MTEGELEQYARHLSLPGVGIKGQEVLLGLRVQITSDAPWAGALRLGLTRAGAQLGEGLHVSSGGPAGEIQFSERSIAVGEIDAPAVWLGALLAAEILWRALGHRPVTGAVRVAFPEFSDAGDRFRQP